MLKRRQTVAATAIN